MKSVNFKKKEGGGTSRMSVVGNGVSFGGGEKADHCPEDSKKRLTQKEDKNQTKILLPWVHLYMT